MWGTPVNILKIEKIGNSGNETENSTIDLNKGLVAYWSFDNCDARDDSGNGNDGEIRGTPECVDGVVGKALSFNAIQKAYITLKRPLNTNKFKSLSFWIYQYGKHTLDDFQVLMSKYDWSGKRNFEILVYDNINDVNRFCVAFFTPSKQEADSLCSYYLENEVLPENVTMMNSKPMENLKWYHVVFTMDDKYMYIFINGKLVAKKKRKFKSYLDSNNVLTYIGYMENAGSDFNFQYYLNAKIDEIRIYNRALSEEEIRALYESVLKGR